MSEQKFSLEMTVSEAMMLHPGAAEVLASYHIGGCAHCHMAQVETLAQVCSGYGIDPNELVTKLNGLIEA